MLGYIFRRVLASIPVILLVAIFSFSLLHLAPGDASSILLGQDATTDDIVALRAKLGLDRPLPIQFLDWFGGVLRGNLGTSVFSGYSVAELMGDRLQATLSLAAMGIFIAVFLGIPMGVLAAWKADTWIDRSVMMFAVLGFSVPVFWLGFLLIWLFAINLDIFPVIGYSPIGDGFLRFLRSMTLPSLALAVAFMALIARMTRSSMVEVLKEDYIRTAHAKGLRNRVVLIRHALRAASLPVVTVIGLVFAAAVAGVVVTETVFSIPGIGRLLVDAVLRRDFPIIQGMMVVIATAYIAVNLAVDVLYAFLDPRIRY